MYISTGKTVIYPSPLPWKSLQMKHYMKSEDRIACFKSKAHY